MNHSPTNPGSDRHEGHVAAGSDPRDSASGDSYSTLPDTVKELSDVLVATDVLLDTIELDNISEIVDVGELATSVDLARLSDAIRERDPDLAFDLSHLERALDRRELWNSIDLSAFVKAKRTLDRELGDVIGNDTSIELPADSKAVSDAKEFIAALQDEAKQALLQQEATEKLTAVREGIVEGHAEFERIYASNKERFARTKARSVAGNPTAVSLLPSGSLPDSVSTRLSTVPADKPNAKIDALPRIYGRRWRRTRPWGTKER